MGALVLPGLRFAAGVSTVYSTLFRVRHLIVEKDKVKDSKLFLGKGYAQQW